MTPPSRLSYRAQMPTTTRPTWWGGVLPTVVLPLVVGVVTAVGTSFSRWGQPLARPLDALGIVLLLAGPAALVVRRRHPPVVYGFIAVVLVGYLAAGYPFGPVFLAPLVALATTVTTGHRWAAYAITAVAFGADTLIFALQHPGSSVGGAAVWLAWLVAFIAGCELWRSRRERLAQARAAREEAERRQASEERLGIARDLHDALGHHVSLINVQAGVALYLMDDDPEQARAALAAIKQSSRELLQEMRSTLGVLRGVDEQPPRQPVAGVARLAELVAENRAAGLAVTVEVSGTPAELPASVDLAAYRIVQEALTNTRRHAGATLATVLLTYEQDVLTVQVDDDGSGPPTHRPPGTPGGNGLPGMRERATALGGSLVTGTGAHGGFRVRATLPITRATADAS